MEDQNAKDDILQNVQQTILMAQRCWDNNDVDKVIFDIQNALRSLLLLRDQLNGDNFNAIESTLLALKDQLVMKTGNAERGEHAFVAARRFDGRRGRPKVIIEKEQLKMLHSLNYTAKQTAERFGCSTKMVYKRYECGLRQRDKYIDLTDDLDSVVDKTQKEFPNAGSVMMSGILQSKGKLVQRKRLRQSIERVNPIPVAQRLAKTVTRRHYQVRMSNSLWHVEGHMKLAR